MHPGGEQGSGEDREERHPDPPSTARQGSADGISSRNVHLCFKLFLRNPCYYNRMISSSESVRPDIEINDGGYSL